MAAPFEVVIAIIVFNVVATLEDTTGNPMYPWTGVFPLYGNILLIPVNILFSMFLGSFMGWVIGKIVTFRATTENETVKKALVGTAAESTFFLFVGAYTLYSLCNAQYISQASGVLAVFTTAVSMNKFAPKATMDGVKTSLAGIWIVAETALFTFTGAGLSYKNENGPLPSQRGFSQKDLAFIVLMLFLGQLGRAGGMLIVELGSLPFQAKHRRTPKYVFCWVITHWIFEMPKATVQATLGSLPYQMHLIPGAEGLTKGHFIMEAATLAVLFLAPIGIFLTSTVGKYFAMKLREMDDEVGDYSDEREEVKVKYGRRQTFSPTGKEDSELGEEGVHNNSSPSAAVRDIVATGGGASGDEERL